jgi:hypothetical protein
MSIDKVVSFEQRRKHIQLDSWEERRFRWRPPGRRLSMSHNDCHCCECRGKEHSITRPDPARNVEYCPLCRIWIIADKGKVVDLPPVEAMLATAPSKPSEKTNA